MKFDWAPRAFKALNGVFCVYKPAGISPKQVTTVLKNKLVEDLNRLPCYKYERNIQVSSHHEKGDNSNLPVSAAVPAKMTDLSEHRLVLGPRYIPEDIKLSPIPSFLEKYSSGVQIYGLGKGRQDSWILRDSMFIRVYHVTGKLGLATQNFSPYGKIVERTSFHHVKKVMIDKICASSQANHTKLMFDYARLDIQSQEAYEEAARGIIRPTSPDTPPLLYGIKCINFNPPYFTLEIHTINETCEYLMQCVHDIGLALRSTAVCSKILRLRYGHFTLSHALLRKHWTLEHIVENLRFCEENLDIDKLLPGGSVSSASNTLGAGEQTGS